MGWAAARPVQKLAWSAVAKWTAAAWPLQSSVAALCLEAALYASQLAPTRRRAACVARQSAVGNRQSAVGNRQSAVGRGSAGPPRPAAPGFVTEASGSAFHLYRLGPLTTHDILLAPYC